MRKRALLVAHQYWPTPGAATQVLTAMVRELRERGSEVDVLTSSPDDHITGSLTGPWGERVHLIGEPEGGGTGPQRALSLLRFAIGAHRRGRMLDYDVVITDPPPTAALAAHRLARLASVPLVYYLADSWGAATADARHPFPRAVHPFVKRVEDYVLRQADLVVAVTGRMRAVAHAAHASDVVLVPNGVPLATFSPEGDVWEPDTTGRPFLVYAGNAGVVHGAEVFALAAEVLWREGRDFAVVYMGYGGDLPRIREIQRRWPARLHLLPNQPTETVAAAYRGAIGALSSLRPFEAYSDARPVKSMTGLAAGCPTVYAGGGEFADLLASLDLGFVTEWSVDGALASLRGVLDLSASDRSAYLDLRRRCAAFANRSLDERLGAERVATRVLELDRKVVS